MRAEAAGSGFAADAAVAGSGSLAALFGAVGSGVAAAAGAGEGAGASIFTTAAMTGGVCSSDLEVAAAGDGAGCGCTAADGAGAGSDASDAVCTPAPNVSVFTSTGRIGSVEPAITRNCAGAALAPASCVTGAFNRTGTLAALATAKRGSAFGSPLASAFGSAFAATFGSGLS